MLFWFCFIGFIVVSTTATTTTAASTISKLQQLLDKDPLNIDLMEKVAMAYTKLPGGAGLIESAKWFSKMAETMNPPSKEAFFNAAMTYMQLGDMKMALSSFKKCIRCKFFSKLKRG